MPQFVARRRDVGLPTVGNLYAVPILSLTGSAFSYQAAYFHPRSTKLLKGLPCSIIDDVTAAGSGLKIGDTKTITVINPTAGLSADLEITIGCIVGAYPGPPGYPPTWVAPPRPFLWIAADELRVKFSFSDQDPLMSVREIILTSV